MAKDYTLDELRREMFPKLSRKEILSLSLGEISQYIWHYCRHYMELIQQLVETQDRLEED